MSYLHKKYEVGEVSICHSRGGLVKLRHINIASEVRKLIGALTGDGSVSKTGGKNSYLIEYVNFDEEIRGLRLADMKSIFGEVNVAEKYVNEKCVGFRLRSNVVGKILTDLGAPPGNKTEQNPALPGS